MNERNIEMLKARLKTLGFSDNADSLLRCHICFGPDEFDIRFQKKTGLDNCSFLVHFIRGEKGIYDCIYYTAILRKPVEIPSDLKILDASMGSINWEGISAVRDGIINDSSFAQDSVKAGEILNELDLKEGTTALKYSYWAGTSLETLIPNLSQFKSIYEISQRFYFMEEQQPISADEAVRFLQSRWLEKRAVAQQKLLTKKKG